MRVEAECRECRRGITPVDVRPGWDEREYLAGVHHVEVRMLKLMRDGGCRHDFEIVRVDGESRTATPARILEVLLEQERADRERFPPRDGK